MGMRFHKAALIGPAVVALAGVLWGFQQTFREYPGVEYENFPQAS
jgi:hypothetical protein